MIYLFFIIAVLVGIQIYLWILYYKLLVEEKELKRLFRKAKWDKDDNDAYQHIMREK